MDELAALDDRRDRRIGQRPQEARLGEDARPLLLRRRLDGHPLVGRGAEWEAVELGQALVDEDAP